jgi:dienelactone hydrolase
MGSGLQIFLWVLAAGALAVLLLAANTALRYTGALAPRESPEARAALLAPALHAEWPDGDGPHPVALLFSGCDGPRDNLDALARTLTQAGWGAVIVDSHGPRGYTARPVWTAICAGQLFTGTERAGDVAVAIDLVRGMAQADPDRLALIGASHGGWAVLDLLSLRRRGRRPPGLAAWPDSIRTEGLAGVRHAVLFYPYCGPGSRVWRLPPPADGPALTFLLVEDDAVADPAPCRDVAQAVAAAGGDVVVEEYAGVTHGFDQREKAPLSPLEYDAAAAERALATVIARLGAAGARRP